MTAFCAIINCANKKCKFLHVPVLSLGAGLGGRPVCRVFAANGFCLLGSKCVNRHTFTCPDYDLSGTCAVDGCRLPHRRFRDVVEDDLSEIGEFFEDHVGDPAE